MKFRQIGEHWIALSTITHLSPDPTRTKGLLSVHFIGGGQLPLSAPEGLKLTNEMKSAFMAENHEKPKTTTAPPHLGYDRH